VRVGINAGFGGWIGEQDLNLIHSLKFRVVRQDIRTSVYLDILSLVDEFGPRPDLMPLFIVGSDTPVPTPDVISLRAVLTSRAAMQNAIPYALEVYNEPDLTAVSPETFASTIRMVVAACPTATVVTGGISSTSKPALSYLRRAMPGIPESCIIGVHTYRKGPPDKPLDGFSSRQAEFDELRSIVGVRKMWNTEIGWNDFKKRGGWCSKPLSPEEVASNLRREIVLCRENDMDVLVVFQLNDGRGAEEHFGIRTVDKILKASAHVAQGV
jgi:hypothetical protein